MSQKEIYEQKTESFLVPILEELSFELVDVEYVKEGGQFYLRAYIDKPGGITIDDCVLVSQRMNEILDREDYVAEEYIFEVSSPGLGRPIKKEKDFKRNLGKMVEVKTYQAIEGQKEFTGLLENYSDSQITLALEEGVMTLERKAIALLREAFDL